MISPHDIAYRFMKLGLLDTSYHRLEPCKSKGFDLLEGISAGRRTAGRRAISSAGVLNFSAGVKLAYAEYNGLIPPMRKIYILSIPFLPPMNFLIAPKFLYNLDPSKYILSIYLLYVIYILY